MATAECNYFSGGGGVSNIDVLYDLVNSTTHTVTINVDNSKAYFISIRRVADGSQYYTATIIGGALDVVNDSITSAGHLSVSYSGGTFTATSTSSNGIVAIEIS